MDIKILEVIATTARGNTVYKVESGGKVYAAKVMNSNDAAKKEAEIQLIAASAGFAPKVYGVYKIMGKPAIIMDYIAKVKKTSTPKQKETIIGQLAVATGIWQRDETNNNFIYGTTAGSLEPKIYMIDFGIVDRMK